jgi:hypothetical protein
MTKSSVDSCRRDEWGDLLRLMMRTTLSVAHELGLSPDSALDCAARHLRFHDFASFASAMCGASRALLCGGLSRNFSATDVAYIKMLAARLKTNRNALACAPSIVAFEIQHHGDMPIQAYERVAAVIRALRAEILHEFSRGDVSDDVVLNDVSGFARALVKIMPAHDGVEAYERASAALLHVRFGVDRQLVVGHADKAGRDLGAEEKTFHAPVSLDQSSWMRYVRHIVRQQNAMYGLGSSTPV